MNDTQLLELLSQTDAYADQLPMPDTAWPSDVAFTAIQDRIGRTPPAGASVRPRTALIAVAVAFTAVLIAGAALLVSLTREGETPPATTEAPSTTLTPTTTVPPTTSTQAPTTTTSSPTTTTAAPSPSAVDLAVINTFIESFNAGDQESAVAMISPGGVYLDDVAGPPDREPDAVSESLDSIRAVFRWRADRHQTLEIQECDLLDSGRISCLVTIDGDIYGATGGIRGILKVFVDDGEFTYFSLLEPQVGEALDMFVTWLQAEYPTEVDTLLSQFAQTDLDLWAERAAEYAATWRE